MKKHTHHALLVAAILTTLSIVGRLANRTEYTGATILAFLVLFVFWYLVVYVIEAVWWRIRG